MTTATATATATILARIESAAAQIYLRYALNGLIIDRRDFYPDPIVLAAAEFYARPDLLSDSAAYAAANRGIDRADKIWARANRRPLPAAAAAYENTRSGRGELNDPIAAPIDSAIARGDFFRPR